jgi:hypothetical protein
VLPRLAGAFAESGEHGEHGEQRQRLDHDQQDHEESDQFVEHCVFGDSAT